MVGRAYNDDRQTNIQTTNHTTIHLLLPFFLVRMHFMSTMVTTGTVDDDDEGFHFHTTSKKPTNCKRVYIGNLPDLPALATKVEKLVNASLSNGAKPTGN